MSYFHSLNVPPKTQSYLQYPFMEGDIVESNNCVEAGGHAKDQPADPWNVGKEPADTVSDPHPSLCLRYRRKASLMPYTIHSTSTMLIFHLLHTMKGIRSSSRTQRTVQENKLIPETFPPPCNYSTYKLPHLCHNNIYYYHLSIIFDSGSTAQP